MTAEQPTPLVMAQQTHHVPDGSRQLIVGKRSTALSCEISAHRQTCHTMVLTATFGDHHPPSCQRVIPPGLFHLLYRPVHPSTGRQGRHYRYCTPCALRVWTTHDVREATA